MNSQKYGRSTLPGLISAPFQPELRLKGKKKAAVKKQVTGLCEMWRRSRNLTQGEGRIR